MLHPRWNDADRTAYADGHLRAVTLPGQRIAPTAAEWDYTDADGEQLVVRYDRRIPGGTAAAA